VSRVNILGVQLMFAALACAQAPRGIWQLPPELAQTEWASLFSGKDLTGWAKVGKDNWSVENGAIHGVGTTKTGGYLRTELKYKDFHLSLRFKCDSDGNSGVFFRTEFANDRPVRGGMQFEIDRKPNFHTGAIYGAGHYFVWPTAEHEMALRSSDWNDFLLKVAGNRYICYLNGFLMVDFTDPGPAFFDGSIAFQLHGESTTASMGGGNMWFKDIFIRDLSKR